MVSPTLAARSSLMPATTKPTSPADRLSFALRLRREHADLLAQVARAGAHQLDPVLGPQRAVDHAHQHHHADVVVEPGIDDQRLERAPRASPRGAGTRAITASRMSAHALAGLGADAQRVLRRDADHVLDLLDRVLGIGRRQVDLVQHRDHLDALLGRGVAVGHGLRLDALRGVDHQHRALAGRQRAAHFVGEVDVPRRVDQVEQVGLAVCAPCTRAPRSAP